MDWITKDGSWGLGSGELRSIQEENGTAVFEFAETSLSVDSFGDGTLRLRFVRRNGEGPRPSKAVVAGREGRCTVTGNRVRDRSQGYRRPGLLAVERSLHQSSGIAHGRPGFAETRVRLEQGRGLLRFRRAVYDAQSARQYSIQPSFRAVQKSET